MSDAADWDDALSHLRAALEFMRSIDCAELSPHDEAELEMLIGRVRAQRDAAMNPADVGTASELEPERNDVSSR